RGNSSHGAGVGPGAAGESGGGGAAGGAGGGGMGPSRDGGAAAGHRRAGGAAAGPGGGPGGRGRHSARAEFPAPGHGGLQACPPPGGGLSVVATTDAAAGASAHFPGVGGAVSRRNRGPARAVGPPLYGGGLDGAGPGEVAASRRPGRQAFGERRGGAALS